MADDQLIPRAGQSFSISNDGRAKFRATLAFVRAEAISAYANRHNRPDRVANPHKVRTARWAAWNEGLQSAKGLEEAIAANRAVPTDPRT